MKPVAFKLDVAKDLATASELLSATSGDIKVLAGGQSLGPILNVRLARPDGLASISEVPILRKTEEMGSYVSFGAAVRHAEIEDKTVPDPSVGMMPHVASMIAYRAVRNKGTLGGSLCHADPAADWVSTMTALDATLVILTNDSETKTLPMLEFMMGAYRTALEPTDILTAVRVPKCSPSTVWGYYKVCRKVGAFADAIVAWVADPVRGYSRVVFGAGTGAPLVSRNLASILAQTGQVPSLETIKEEISLLDPRLDHVKAHLFTIALQRCVAGALGNE